MSLEQMLVENIVEALMAGFTLTVQKRSDGMHVAGLSIPGVTYESIRASLFDAITGAMLQANEDRAQ